MTAPQAGETYRTAHNVTARLAVDPAGGRVILQATAVHARECPAWRMGRRHGPCDCGAHALWQLHQDWLAGLVERAAGEVRP